ncbi:MAG: hypothetical protein ACXWL8_05420 [Candidatus Limnocylindria bacterium]
MDTAILLELEQAELAARDRRLAAELEAGRILDDARTEAQAIDAGIERRISRVIATRRRRHRVAAEREIAAMEAEMAALDPAGPPGIEAPPVGRRRPPLTPSLDRAVELVVAAVLGEDDGG